jgi:hypothetical protein
MYPEVLYNSYKKYGCCFYKEKLHTNGFLSILLVGVCKKNFLPCPVHPALLHNFGCCYIILMRHKKNQDKNEQFSKICV